MLRVVLDANIIVSAGITSSGTPATLLTQWGEGSFWLIASLYILGEAERTLVGKIGMSSEDVRSFLHTTTAFN